MIQSGSASAAHSLPDNRLNDQPRVEQASQTAPASDANAAVNMHYIDVAEQGFERLHIVGDLNGQPMEFALTTGRLQGVEIIQDPLSKMLTLRLVGVNGSSGNNKEGSVTVTLSDNKKAYVDPACIQRLGEHYANWGEGDWADKSALALSSLTVEEFNALTAQSADLEPLVQTSNAIRLLEFADYAVNKTLTRAVMTHAVDMAMNLNVLAANADFKDLLSEFAVFAHQDSGSSRGKVEVLPGVTVQDVPEFLLYLACPTATSEQRQGSLIGLHRSLGIQDLGVQEDTLSVNGASEAATEEKTQEAQRQAPSGFSLPIGLSIEASLETKGQSLSASKFEHILKSACKDSRSDVLQYLLNHSPEKVLGAIQDPIPNSTTQGFATQFLAMNEQSLRVCFETLEENLGNGFVKQLFERLAPQCSEPRSSIALSPQAMKVGLEYGLPVNTPYHVRYNLQNDMFSNRMLPSLHCAVLRGDLGFMRVALEKGGSLDLEREVLTAAFYDEDFGHGGGNRDRNRSYEKPLSLAIKSNQFDAAVLLLQASRERDITVPDNAALVTLLQRGDLSLIPPMLAAGQSPTASSHSVTPLIAIAGRSVQPDGEIAKENAIRTLLEAGAGSSISEINDQGLQAWQIAEQTGMQPDLVDLLRPAPVAAQAVAEPQAAVARRSFLRRWR